MCGEMDRVTSTYHTSNTVKPAVPPQTIDEGAISLAAWMVDGGALDPGYTPNDDIKDYASNFLPYCGETVRTNYTEVVRRAKELIPTTGLEDWWTTHRYPFEDHDTP